MQFIWNSIWVWVLRLLLRWYAANQMDQWERWEIETKNKPSIYITISWISDGYNYDKL